MQHLKIIKNHNQKAFIFLLKSDFGVFAVAALASHGNFRITDTQLATKEELEVLSSQKEILKKRGITVVDLIDEKNVSQDFSQYAEVMLLAGVNSTIPTHTTFNSVASPYFVFSFNEAQFFSTQKTRGPNII